MDAVIIIPLVAITGGLSIPIFWLFLDSKAKDRRARVIEKAIEAGHSPQEVVKALNDGEPNARPNRRIRFRKGLVLMAVGLALLVTNDMGYGHGDDGMVVGGMICLFLGIAFFLSDLFNGKEKVDH